MAHSVCYLLFVLSKCKAWRAEYVLFAYIMFAKVRAWLSGDGLGLRMGILYLLTHIRKAKV
jgi:hypothetical protein